MADFLILSVGKVGVEPTRSFPHRFLRPTCIPFHHLPLFLVHFIRFGLISQLRSRTFLI